MQNNCPRAVTTTLHIMTFATVTVSNMCIDGVMLTSKHPVWNDMLVASSPKTRHVESIDWHWHLHEIVDKE